MEIHFKSCSIQGWTRLNWSKMTNRKREWAEWKSSQKIIQFRLERFTDEFQLMKSIAEMQTTKKSAMSLVMLTAALLLGRQQEAEGGDGVVRERPPMLGDAIGLRSRGAPTNPTSSSTFIFLPPPQLYCRSGCDQVSCQVTDQIPILEVWAYERYYKCCQECIQTNGIQRRRQYNHLATTHPH